MLKHSYICNTPKWEVFHLPPKTNVRYSLVFNQKRDFQQSVEKFNEESNYSKISSCCIVDNSVYSSMNNKNMDIIFFDGNECCSCLSLRLFFPKQLLMKKSNSLLVFLNKFQRGGIYKLQNTCMYIKCTDGLKWTLFYDLFEFLVKSSGKSIIGALFYIHFVCKDLIFKELCFLQSINENKNPIHFNLICTSNFQARKTKGSETTGIVSKRQFGINVSSEYKFQVAKKEVLAKKRKFIDADPVDKCKYLKYQLFSQKICRCKENKWQLLKSLVKRAAYNYTDILEARGILNELETTHTKSMDTSICSNIIKAVTAGVMETNLIPVSSIETTVTLSNRTKIPLMWKPYPIVSETINEVGTIMKNGRNEIVHDNASNKCINKNDTKPKNNDVLQDSLDDLGNIQSIYSEHISDNTDDKKSVTKQGNINSSKIFSEKTKCYEKNHSFMTFQTASGKPLSISEKALQTAKKMYTEVCSQVINTAKNEQNSSFENLQGEVRDYNSKHDSGFPCALKPHLSKEYFDDNIDNVLVDKFFEEIPFDEKEVDCKPYSQPGQPSLVQSGKVRKSLGGRRSLKPYIKKLS